MYEAELGHTLVDAIAILFCFWAVFSKRKAGRAGIAVACLMVNSFSEWDFYFIY